MVLAWLLLGGLIEIFLAQLGDMRYFAMPATSKVLAPLKHAWIAR
jgi:hypothetical protein